MPTYDDTFGRFGELWQISRDYPGILSQREAIRATLHPVYNTNRHRLAKRLDRHINRQTPPRSYLPIGILDLGQLLGHGGNHGIFLSHWLKDPIIVRNQIAHELGHVITQTDLLTQTDKWTYQELISGHHNGSWPHEYEETFCDSVRDWWISDGQDVPALTPILIGAAGGN